MFNSITDLADKLAATGYFIDSVMTQVVFLAAKLQKPLLLEGPAGSGKTQLAISVAAAAGTHVERLQCYRGVTEDKAIGRFDEGLQRLYMEFSKGQNENWQSVQANLKGRDFFRPGPLMRALECERPCVLLIDELDKVDEGFEAMLLEILSAWQLSTAEILRDFVRKGSRLYVEGALRTRSWDDRQTGQRRYRSEIVVTEVSLLSPPPDGGSDDVEHYVSGRGFAPPEFSEEPEITQEEVPY